MVTFSISRVDFEFIRDFVNDRSAIVLDDGKEYLVESRLLQVIRKNGLGSLEELINKLRFGHDALLQESVIDAMTTNETSWFRDIHPFEVLRHKVLPEIFVRNNAHKDLQIWCAACSSGQEPYTIAMLLREYFLLHSDWNIRILGCDLSSEMIERAKAGLYSKLELNRGLPAQLMVKYFAQDGHNARIKKEIRDMIEYRRMNLAYYAHDGCHFFKKRYDLLRPGGQKGDPAQGQNLAQTGRLFIFGGGRNDHQPG